jgi:hypothetical protein
MDKRRFNQINNGDAISATTAAVNVMFNMMKDIQPVLLLAQT